MTAEEVIREHIEATLQVQRWRGFTQDDVEELMREYANHQNKQQAQRIEELESDIKHLSETEDFTKEGIQYMLKQLLNKQTD